MKKQLISVLLLLSLLLGLLPFGAAAAGNPFTDVKASQYYYDAVLWAVEKGVTNGTDATHFSPDAQCTRAQVVTFLWRALGQPECSGSNPFRDVKAGQYYYDAVLWAVREGVTNGTSATTFGPDEVVTRAQFVTFLWRALGKPAFSKKTGFTDVKANQYYYDAVLWAAEAGVTNGTDANHFSPDQSCLRGQTVTFLYRALRNYIPGGEEPTEPTTEPTEPTTEPTEPTTEPATEPSEPDEKPQEPVESITKTETVYRTVKLTYWGDGACWHFEVNLKNESDKPVTVTKITIQDLCAGNDVYAPHVADMDALYNMFDLTADPGETIQWVDDLPVVYCINGRRYTMELEDTAGNTFVRTYILTYSLEGYHDPKAENATALGTTAPEETVLRSPEDRWDYELWFRNDTGKTLHLVRMVTQNMAGDSPAGAPFIHNIETLRNLYIPQYLAPGQVGSFADGHPYVDFMDSRSYTIVYADDDGTEYAADFHLLLSLAQYHPELEKTYPDFSGDNGKDNDTMRHDAAFSVKVADGVYWVPANALGSSSYTNAQIQSMLTDTPEEKQTKIDTLYEALQLYQIGGFYGSDDNVRIFENGYSWEHHKPGYDAVRTNHGCCASCTDWLNYILKDDYDEMGFIGTCSLTGGHVFNYIKQDGWYYFVDLTKWYAENWNCNAVESGDLSDYAHSDRIYGNIHRAASLDAFVNYILDASGDPPGIIDTYRAADVAAMTEVWTADGGIQLIYADNVEITVLYDDPTDTLTYTFAAAPTKTKDWSRDEDFAFASMRFD